MLLLEEEQGIGACELIPIENQAVEEEKKAGNSIWQIRQLSMAKRENSASLFVFLVKSAVSETWRAGGKHLRVSPLDDIIQPRLALPDRYDAADIGYASFYARAGFRRLEPVRSSYWSIQNGWS